MLQLSFIHFYIAADTCRGKLARGQLFRSMSAYPLATSGSQQAGFYKNRRGRLGILRDRSIVEASLLASLLKADSFAGSSLRSGNAISGRDCVWRSTRPAKHRNSFCQRADARKWSEATDL
jgi:hypothetical protein